MTISKAQEIFYSLEALESDELNLDDPDQVHQAEESYQQAMNAVTAIHDRVTRTNQISVSDVEELAVYAEMAKVEMPSIKSYTQYPSRVNLDVSMEVIDNIRSDYLNEGGKALGVIGAGVVVYAIYKLIRYIKGKIDKWRGIHSKAAEVLKTSIAKHDHNMSRDNEVAKINSLTPTQRQDIYAALQESTFNQDYVKSLARGGKLQHPSKLRERIYEDRVSPVHCTLIDRTLSGKPGGMADLIAINQWVVVETEKLGRTVEQLKKDMVSDDVKQAKHYVIHAPLPQQVRAYCKTFEFNAKSVDAISDTVNDWATPNPRLKLPAIRHAVIFKYPFRALDTCDRDLSKNLASIEDKVKALGTQVEHVSERGKRKVYKAAFVAVKDDLSRLTRLYRSIDKAKRAQYNFIRELTASVNQTDVWFSRLIRDTEAMAKSK